MISSVMNALMDCHIRWRNNENIVAKNLGLHLDVVLLVYRKVDETRI